MTMNIGSGQIDDKKFDQVTADLKRYRIRQLKKLKEPNSKFVVEYIISKMREGNLKPATRANTIDRLSRLSLFHNNKPFSEMTKEDIHSYLDTMLFILIWPRCIGVSECLWLTFRVTIMNKFHIAKTV